MGTIISRIERLELDMVALKQQQGEHQSQIEVLAFEVHTTNERVDSLEKTMNRRFRQLDHKIDLISTDLKMVLEALAIKY